MRPMLLYVDTSVFGGVFDAEFMHYSKLFFAMAGSGVFRLVVSNEVVDELASAPPIICQFFNSLRPGLTILEISAEMRRLGGYYLRDGVVGQKSHSDAVHVACATLHVCDGLVSWNYKHITHPRKALLFNLVNTANGYKQLFIDSPKEVIDFENKRRQR